MKATGIVRRIDDLGRLVIPKELRRNLKIRNGDTIEIFIAGDGEVILKKYSPIGDLDEFSQEYTDTLYETVGHIALVCDRDKIVAVSGAPKKEFLVSSLDPTIEKVISERKAILINDQGDPYFREISIIDGNEKFRVFSKVIAPIISGGESIGAVILLSKEQEVKMGELELKMAGTAASFLSKQLEV